MLVRMELLPVHSGIEGTALFDDDGKFFFTAQIIAYIMIIDKSLALMGGIFHQNGNRYGRTAAGAKNFSALAT